MLRLALALTGVLSAQQGEDESLRFLREEAEVVTGSLRPGPARRTASTVYVIYGDDLRRSGAQTLWDALRLAPGVDVMTIHALHGVVSLRGLNKAANNRVLVLLDGRTVLNGFFDFPTWEAIPVALEDVDRIEVAPGPASSVYGANALLGVINIITDKPGHVPGVRLNAWYGERDTLLVNQQVAGRHDRTSYKLTTSQRAGAGFTDPGRRAGETGSFSSTAARSLRGGGEARLSGGVSRHHIETTGEPVAVVNSGITGFLRGDYERGRFQSRVFWNAGRGRFLGLAPFGDPSVDYDTVDGTVAHGLEPAAGHDLVVGAAYRLNSARSGFFEQGPVEQHLGGVFLEDAWDPAEGLRLLAGGRLDRHPRTGWTLSPRGGLSWEPAAGHALRLTAGTSYRNPTLIENEIQITARSAAAETSFVGNHDLSAERLSAVELGYSADLRGLHVSAALYRYRLVDQVAFVSRLLSAGPPVVAQGRPVNAGTTRAQGAELALEAPVCRVLSAFGSYAYQSLKDSDPAMGLAPAAPRHKVNAGLRFRRAGWTASAWAHWQARTVWSGRPVAGYALLNLWAGYVFRGGHELGLSAFNAADAAHYEGAPVIFEGLPSGRGATRVRRRLMLVGRWRL